jgi:hypothetical protein
MGRHRNNAQQAKAQSKHRSEFFHSKHGNFPLFVAKQTKAEAFLFPDGWATKSRREQYLVNARQQASNFSS